MDKSYPQTLKTPSTMSINCVHNKHRKIAERVDIKVLARIISREWEKVEKGLSFFTYFRIFKIFYRSMSYFCNLKNLILKKIQDYKCYHKSLNCDRVWL